MILDAVRGMYLYLHEHSHHSRHHRSTTRALFRILGAARLKMFLYAFVAVHGVHARENDGVALGHQANAAIQRPLGVVYSTSQTLDLLAQFVHRTPFDINHGKICIVVVILVVVFLPGGARG